MGLEKVIMRARVRRRPQADLEAAELQLTTPGGRGVVVSLREPSQRALQPLSEYAQKVVRMRQRGLLHPWEIVRMLTPPLGARSGIPSGEFVEYDLDDSGALAPCQRKPGCNRALMPASGIICLKWPD